MPWNDNSNGGGDGGNNGGGGPWGNGGGKNNGGDKEPQNPWSGSARPPSRRPGAPGPSGNLDDLARKVEDRLRGVLGGGGGGGRKGGGGGQNGRGGMPEPLQLDRRAIGAIGLVVFLGWLATGVYVVENREEAVIQRFGKYIRTEREGLKFHLPQPIETHTKLNVRNANELLVGAVEGSNSTDGLMLTGDQNIVDVGFRVLWQIDNSKDYLFQVAHGDGSGTDASETVKAVAEAAIREVVGRSQRDQVLATGRAGVEAQTRELIQKTLSQYRAGIRITQVNLTKAEPPASVNDAFQAVAAASQEAETKINQARSYRNAVVPQAQGEAARFNQLYQEYKLAPDVTRQRLYLETMEKVYERANKVLVDTGKGGTAPMMVLPPELFRNPTPPAAGPRDSQPSTPTPTPQGAGR